MFLKRSEIFKKKKEKKFVTNFRNTAVETDEWRICDVKNLAWTKIFDWNLINWIELR